MRIDLISATFLAFVVFGAVPLADSEYMRILLFTFICLANRILMDYCIRILYCTLMGYTIQWNLLIRTLENVDT